MAEVEAMEITLVQRHKKEKEEQAADRELVTHKAQVLASLPDASATVVEVSVTSAAAAVDLAVDIIFVPNTDVILAPESPVGNNHKTTRAAKRREKKSEENRQQARDIASQAPTGPTAAEREMLSLVALLTPLNLNIEEVKPGIWLPTARF